MDEKKPNILVCYGRMWKKAFDFKGLATRREFWLAFLANAIVIAILFAAGLLINPNILLGVYFLASFIPFTSMAVRRLHDAGKSGFWVLLIYFGIGLFLCALGSACAIYTMSHMVCVYGPPPEDNIPYSETSVSEYNPEDNAEVCVYGPPGYFEGSEE